MNVILSIQLALLSFQIFFYEIHKTQLNYALSLWVAACAGFAFSVWLRGRQETAKFKKYIEDELHFRKGGRCG